MATQLEIVNKVLRRLREDSVVATNATEYSELIGDFVVDAYEEVIDEHQWEALKHRVVVDIASGTSKYELTRNVTDGGNARNSDSRVCKIDSELQFISDMPQIWMFDDDTDDSYSTLYFLTPEAFKTAKNIDRDDTDVDPSYITLYTEVDTTVSPAVTRLYMELYPEPAATRVVELDFWTKTDALEVDGTTDTTNLLIPDRPVFHHALMTAYNERGEEIGEPGNLADRRYAAALAVAIDKDILTYELMDRSEWRRD